MHEWHQLDALVIAAAATAAAVPVVLCVCVCVRVCVWTQDDAGRDLYLIAKYD